MNGTIARRLVFTLALALALAACTTSEDATTSPDQPTDDVHENKAEVADTSATRTYAFCDGGIAALYDPLSGTRMDSLPDDFYTEAADTNTGVRVAFGDLEWLNSLPESYEMIYRDVEGLDGWGLNAGIHLRFDQAVSFADDLEGVGGKVGLYRLSNGEATPIPFEVRSIDEGRAALFFPLIPLRQGTEHVLVIHADALSPSTECIRASSTLKDLLTGRADDPKLATLQPRYQTMLETLGLQADAIGAAVVFTTQTVVEQSIAAANDISQRDILWDSPPTCTTTDDGGSICTGTFGGLDYRLDDGNFADTPQGNGTSS